MICQIKQSVTPVIRDFCARCLRAKKTCYCGEVRTVYTPFRIVILQHPLEQRKSIGTARMAHHCVANSQLIVGAGFDGHPLVERLICAPENRCVVLYPGDHSQNLNQLDVNARKKCFPSLHQLVIFVIDGTWACAKSMLKRSHGLSQLPQICFTPQRESQYKIRRQPDKNYLSTIEAVHHLMEIFTPEIDASALLEIFQSMVERQVAYSKMGIIRACEKKGLLGSITY